MRVSQLPIFSRSCQTINIGINTEIEYSDGVDELLISNIAVSVLIEVVVNTGELLGSHENTKFRGHLLEFKLVQRA